MLLIKNIISLHLYFMVGVPGFRILYLAQLSRLRQGQRGPLEALSHTVLTFPGVGNLHGINVLMAGSLFLSRTLTTL